MLRLEMLLLYSVNNQHTVSSEQQVTGVLYISRFSRHESMLAVKPTKSLIIAASCCYTRVLQVFVQIQL